MEVRIHSYIQQFNQIFDGQPWLDEPFCKKLDNLSDSEVFTQSPNQNHSVAEVVSHLIVWRREVLRRLRYNASDRLLTEESADNWTPLTALIQLGWQHLYADFRQSQKELIDFLQAQNDSFLEQQLGDTEWNKEYFVAGLLHHDIYHLGQIGLILKWAK